MNKELVNRLLDELENLHIENLAMRSYIMAVQRRFPNSPAAEPLIEAKRRSQDIRAQAKALFAPLRAQIEQGETLENLIQGILRATPEKKDAN